MRIKVKFGCPSAVAVWSDATHAFVIKDRPVHGDKAPIVNVQAAKDEDVGFFTESALFSR